jgi:hypothetical protein
MRRLRAAVTTTTTAIRAAAVVAAAAVLMSITTTATVAAATTTATVAAATTTATTTTTATEAALVGCPGRVAREARMILLASLGGSGSVIRPLIHPPEVLLPHLLSEMNMSDDDDDEFMNCRTEKRERFFFYKRLFPSWYFALISFFFSICIFFVSSIWLQHLVSRIFCITFCVLVACKMYYNSLILILPSHSFVLFSSLFSSVIIFLSLPLEGHKPMEALYEPIVHTNHIHRLRFFFCLFGKFLSTPIDFTSHHFHSFLFSFHM